jgi:hypothetical protein
VLYGCVKTAYVSLHAQTPPVITVDRSAVSLFVDRIGGTVSSDNGPPYAFSFFGLAPNPPTMAPWQLMVELDGTTAVYTLAPLPATTSFDIIVTDRGNCTNTFFTEGRVITDQQILQSPTPLPHRFTPLPNQSVQIETLLTENEPKNLKLLVVVLSVVSFSVLAFAVFYTFYR